MSSHISTSMTFLLDDGTLHLCTQDDGEFDARVVDFLADAKYEPVVLWIGRDTEANLAFLRNLEDTAGITIGGLLYGTGTYAGRVGAETCGSNGGSEAESVRLCMFRDSWQLLDSRGLLSSSQIFTRVKVLFCTDPREGALRALEHLSLLPDFSVNGVEDLVPVDDVLGIPLCPPYAVPFGMHKGKHIGQVPATYIHYMKTRPNPSVQLRSFFAYYDLYEDTPRVRSAHWDALEATMRTFKHNTVLQSPGNYVVDYGSHCGKQLSSLEPTYVHYLATCVASERYQKLAADYYDLLDLPAPVNALFNRPTAQAQVAVAVPGLPSASASPPDDDADIDDNASCTTTWMRNEHRKTLASTTCRRWLQGQPDVALDTTDDGTARTPSPPTRLPLPMSGRLKKRKRLRRFIIDEAEEDSDTN